MIKVTLQLFAQEGEAAAPAPGPQAEDERQSAFNGLIYGQYKDLYQQHMDSLIQKRFKAYGTLEKAYRESAPVMDMLTERYGTRDAAALRAVLDRESGSGASDGVLYDQWEKEAEALQSRFPDFDMERECENPQFMKLLQSGVDMETAYIALNRDAVIGNALSYAARTAQQRTLDALRARSARPVENGIRSAPGVSSKTDVSKLTPQERRDIARRAEQGEKITF